MSSNTNSKLELSPPKNGDRKLFLGFTKRQIHFLLIFGVANFFRAATILNIGPFYPPEAEKKNVSATLTGFIISSFDFTTFLTTLIYGLFVIKWLGPQLVFNLAIGCTGIYTIFLGLVPLLGDDKHDLFIGLSFATRILGGFGEGGCYPSMFVIFAMEFKDKIALSVGILEVFFGIGGILGPIISGALIDISSYTVVTSSLGAIIILIAIANHFLIPDFVETPKEFPLSLKVIFSIIRLPRVFLPLFCLLFTASSIGYITGTLEKHLEKFELTSFENGLVFSLSVVVYTILSPIWGHIFDTVQFFKNATAIIGTILILIAYSFLGPLPFIPGDHKLWNICVGLAIHGIGIGGTIMTTYPRALQAAVDNGFESTVSTQGLISSIYILTFTLGNGIGPSISGLLYDIYGFRSGTLFIIVFGLIVLFLEIILVRFFKR